MSSESVRVLLIDDNPDQASPVQIHLRNLSGMGFAVETATDLESGLARALSGSFDVLLLSLDLPDCRGLPALARVRSALPLTPVVTLAGPPDGPSGYAALEMGAQDYLSRDELTSSTLARTLRSAALRMKAAQAALAERERLYPLLVRNGQFGIWQIGKDERTEFVNGRMLDMLGLPDPAALEEHSYRDFFTPETLAVLETEYEKRLKGQASSYEGQIVNAQKHIRDVLVFGAPIMDAGGQLASTLALIVDVTDQKEAERQQRDLLEAMNDVTTAVNSTLDLDKVLEQILENVERVVPHDTANIMLIDGDVARIVKARGYTELDPEHPPLPVHPIQETPSFRRMEETRQPLIVNDVFSDPGWLMHDPHSKIRSYAGAPICQGEQVIGFLNLDSHQMGAFLPEHARILQMFANPAAVAIQNARLYRELENYSSILEQAVDDATEEMRKARDHAETVLNSVGEAVLVVDSDGLIELVNEAFTEQTGYTREEAKGARFDRFLLADDTSQAPSHNLPDMLHRSKIWRGEAVIRRKDGGSYDAALTISTLQRPGEDRGYVASLRDISALKEIQRIKDSFISTAAHELRTPLTSIQGFSEILLHRALEPERQRRYLQIINTQSSQISQIIDELLDISRLEAGRGLDIKPEPFDLRTLINEVVETFTDAFPGHRYVVDCASFPPVKGDPFRLAQVLRNLLSNATKYSPQGGLVTIQCRTQGGFLLVNVEDEGIGMTPEQQQHLFEKFYRADSSNTSIGGTGLGLTISKLIVELHGGMIWAESEYGVGSRFNFTVPLAQGVDEAARQPGEPVE